MLSTFGKKLGVPSKLIGQFIDCKDGSIEIEALKNINVNWEDYKKEERESIITAFVAIS
ncbi:hypothetical protein D3C86_2236310 [compost metagenome]